MLYTICTKEEWRSESFDPYYFEMVYGVFRSLRLARERAEEIDGVVVELNNKCKEPILTR